MDSNNNSLCIVCQVFSEMWDIGLCVLPKIVSDEASERILSDIIANLVSVIEMPPIISNRGRHPGGEQKEFACRYNLTEPEVSKLMSALDDLLPKLFRKKYKKADFFDR